MEHGGENVVGGGGHTPVRAKREGKRKVNNRGHQGNRKNESKDTPPSQEVTQNSVKAIAEEEGEEMGRK